MLLKNLITMEDSYTNCELRLLTKKEALFSDNNFIAIIENGTTYFVNTDYIISYEILPVQVHSQQ
jgi:hypothetical protein